jgi:hypothetical protein
VTGFDTVDADRLLGPEPDPLGRKSGTGEFSMDPNDSVPRLETEGPSVSQHGDLWDLGTHRLFHGDALDPRSYEVLLGDEVVTQIVTDPPYSRGHVSSRPFRELMAAGETSPKEFRGFLARALSLAAERHGAARYSMSSWTGITWARCRRRSATQALSSRIYVFGPSRRPAWEVSIAASTN